MGFIRWRGHQALKSDTRTVIAQGAQQLVRALQSRRGTLTFVRDVLNRRADLSRPQLEAMGASAVRHTRHLLGVGLLRPGAVNWWADPETLSAAELKRLNQTILSRQQLRGMWRSPSTFDIEISPERMLLVMLEPLRSKLHGETAVVGVFDLRPMLTYFFASTLPPGQPIRVLVDDEVLYQSTNWRSAAKNSPAPILVESPVAVDAARWILQMQPGATSVVETLSWFNWLLIGLSALAGLGLSVIVWILAARTWLLQRAVDRRTAALRRVTRRLRELAITDELTGLHNRRFFLDRWEWECDRAKRYQRPLVCLMIDVNGFKQVNDRLGHRTGDTVLKQVAQELKAVLRTSDVLARFGGDEFIVALPETDHSQAEAVMEKLQQVQIPVPGGQGLPPVTLSVGMGRIQGEQETAQQVLEAADQSLYASKQRIKSPPRRW